MVRTYLHVRLTQCVFLILKDVLCSIITHVVFTKTQHLRGHLSNTFPETNGGENITLEIVPIYFSMIKGWLERKIELK